MRDYQLIRVGSTWHLTQQQARPPARSELACHTSCGKWAEMKDGFERGRPTCPTCVEHVTRFERGRVDELPCVVYGYRPPAETERYLDVPRLRGSRRRRALL